MSGNSSYKPNVTLNDALKDAYREFRNDKAKLEDLNKINWLAKTRACIVRDANELSALGPFDKKEELKVYEEQITVLMRKENLLQKGQFISDFDSGFLEKILKGNKALNTASAFGYVASSIALLEATVNSLTTGVLGYGPGFYDLLIFAVILIIVSRVGNHLIKQNKATKIKYREIEQYDSDCV